MGSLAYTDTLRAIATASLLTHGIPGVVHSEWRLFGSWAIALQSAWVARFPNDLDIEVAQISDLDRVSDGWLVRTPGLELRARPAREIAFSAQHRTLSSLWQEVAIVVGGAVMATELLNWVCRQDTTLPLGGSNVDEQSRVPLFPTDDERSPTRRSGIGSYPVVSLEECIALKWARLASVRTHGRRHTRWEDAADLYDAVILGAAHCNHEALVHHLRRISQDRRIAWPALLVEAPAEWADFWDRYNYVSGVNRPSPSSVINSLNEWWLGICGGVGAP